ncbi:hypothetical protein CANINC_002731 [Pichia inconspicua]|uniref:Tyrosine-protein phosphatase OCA6 n=1 Tax=Pichia inconspicua TaxID=52247 RepID=A0A4T0X0K4_9ASCO|nr:hypothetical protein CANINC_002731 [[Candida] inconspicua]
MTNTDITIVPPIRYNRVQSTLSRGGLPTSNNFSFLKLLDVNTIIGLTPKSIYTEEESIDNKSLIQFIEESNIEYIHFPTDSSAKDKGKNREIPISDEQVIKVIELILRRDSGNIYLYCLNGGQIVSLVIACLRKVQLWSNVSIFEEFICFSQSANNNDRMFVEEFSPKLKVPKKSERVEWLWTGLNENVILNHPSLKDIEFEERLGGT